MNLRSISKHTLLLVIKSGVAPLVASYRIELALWPAHRHNHVLQTYSQILSTIPGLSGQFVRRAFYSSVLTECHAESCIQWGTIFSTADVRIARGVYIGARCMVGRAILDEHVTLGSNVDILSGKNQHGFDDPDVPVQDQPGRYEHVRVGTNTWIGNGAIVMADIGARSVIAAGSVVTRALPDDVIAGGNPAKILKHRDPETKRWI
jgi:virginiamycin A acetyltransferase